MKKFMALSVAMVFAIGIFSLAGAGVAHAKELKIAYVDLAKVFDDYKKTKDLEKKLEDKGRTKESERTKMIDELRKLKDEQALLSEKAKGEKQTVIDNKIKALQEFDKKAREELMKERNDMLGGILKDIEEIVTEYSKANGYDYIMNSRMLLYGAEQYDMTNEILTRLNNKK